ncbi:hypothetical protein BP6252_10057 [Coleophoma cylindrospora]|uniref:Major facilitator superfamily (MFS) profile domain-containing protein n=1 Tax=Coleophoma cylindrospora TaxID=1849047 RepID=A0A3D8QXA0_9HELO|nr:hypothetical protein BP6252_10057 [Coleophoma cylindrospora]
MTTTATTTLPTAGIEDAPQLQLVGAAVTRTPTTQPNPGLSDDIEMQPMTCRSSARLYGTAHDNHPSPTIQPSGTPDGASGCGGAAVDQIQSIWKPYMNRYRVLATCLTALGNGMNDSAQGALLASLEKQYSINYAVVSTIFVATALGFIIAAFFISSLSLKVGRGKALLLAEVLLAIGYGILLTTPPFAVVVCVYFVLGLGMATNLTIGQVFNSNLANNTAVLGAFQGLYSIGGIVGPLIATGLISSGTHWSVFYAIPLGLAVLNAGLCVWAFWGFESESGELVERASVPIVSSENGNQHPQSVKSKVKENWKAIRKVVANRPTFLGALFIFTYQGAEVAISGWVISFLVQIRHGDPSRVGFVTAGFWGGITLGRFTLSFLAHRFGERPSVFIMTVGVRITTPSPLLSWDHPVPNHPVPQQALAIEFLVWFLPSVAGSAVAVSLSGLLLGPISPSATHIFQRLIPRKDQLAALSVIGSVEFWDMGVTSDCDCVIYRDARVLVGIANGGEKEKLKVQGVFQEI